MVWKLVLKPSKSETLFRRHESAVNWIKERCPSHQVLLPSTKTSHPHYTKWALWIKMEGANIVWRNNCTQVLVLISRVLLHQRQHIVEIKSPGATGLKFLFCSPHFLQLKINKFLAMASFSRLSGNFKEQWKKTFYICRYWFTNKSWSS